MGIFGISYEWIFGVGYEENMVIDKGTVGTVYEGIFGAGYEECWWLLGVVYVEHMVPSMKGIWFLSSVEYDTYHQGNIVLVINILFDSYHS